MIKLIILLVTMVRVIMTVVVTVVKVFQMKVITIFIISKLYKLGGELGKGGFGVVYAAVRRADKLQVNIMSRIL